MVPVTADIAEAVEVNPFALLTATQAALFAGVSVQAVWNWHNRGHLPAATDDDGNEITDSRGKRLYRLVDLARADAKMAGKREQMALRLISGSAPA